MRQADLVRRGYDLASQAHRDDQGRGAYPNRLGPHLSLALREAPPGEALDLGCGNGLPHTRRLAAQRQTLGVDLSPVQIARARRLVPTARFRAADMTTLHFRDARFSLITAFYSIIHVPASAQLALVRRITAWLRPGGWLVLTLGQGTGRGFEKDWLGVKGATMAWSQRPKEAYERQFRRSKLETLRHQWIEERDGVGHNLYILRRKT